MPKTLFEDPVVVGFPEVHTEAVTTAGEEINYSGTGGEARGMVYELDQPFDLRAVACAWIQISPELEGDEARLECEEGGQAFAYLLLLNEDEEEVARCFHYAAASTAGGVGSVLSHLRRQVLTPDDIAPGVTDTMVRKVQAVIEGESLSQPPEEIEAVLKLPETTEVCHVS